MADISRGEGTFLGELNQAFARKLEPKEEVKE
jgi:hypothetical protein